MTRRLGIVLALLAATATAIPLSRMHDMMRVASRDRAATFTVTTTSAAQTLTLHSLGVSAETTVDWGDGSVNEYTGTAERTHVYADADTYTVRILQPQNVTTLDLRDTQIALDMDVNARRFTGLTTALGLHSIDLTWTVSDTAPFPDVTSYVTLYTLPNLTWTVSESAPFPDVTSSVVLRNLPDLTWTVSETLPFPDVSSYVYLHTLPDLTWTVSESAPFPDVTSSVYLNTLPNLTWTVSESAPFPDVTSSVTLHTLPNLTWTASATAPFPDVTSYVTLYTLPNLTWGSGAAANLGRVGNYITYYNNLSTTAVDVVLYDLYTMTTTRTATGGTLNLHLVGNAAPTGTFQASTDDPVTAATDGAEVAYELREDSLGEGFNTWGTVNITDPPE